MHENDKEKNIKDKESEKLVEEEADKSSWSEDQKTGSYYYDDAYGYEVYNADEEDEEDS